ncbi:Essential recombination function protein [uncultured Caudovirales phage]|uniref:Essential recombination function protein n=1 Tax=uncultured Caudovirales phage TaxID=2100421 RepID=A0A6J7XN94_9CAUD|nr:Essential recombination function protein [uncultured Caudovirales phage]
MPVYKKLLALQANPVSIAKDGKAQIPGRAGYKYMTLDSILDELIPRMNAVGLVLCQRIDFSDSRDMSLITEIIDTDDETKITSNFPIPPTTKAQDVGSFLTYYRRYSLTAMVGIAADEDDDAASVSRPAAPAARTQPATPAAPAKPMFRPMLVEFKDKLGKYGFNWTEKDSLDAVWDYAEGQKLVPCDTPENARGQELGKLLGSIGVPAMQQHLDTLFKGLVDVPQPA